MSFGPLTGDSKAIKEDQSISLLHTLALALTAAPRKVFVGSEKKKVCLMVMP